MSDPSISVIIPAYDAAGTITRALDSAVASIARARAELDFDSEIIVVDDCSRDDTLEVCARFRAPQSKLVLVRNARNRGTAFCQNEGARLSRADLLFFLHADDRYLPDHVRLCVEALEGDEGLGWVQTRLHLPEHLHPTWVAPTNDSHAINKCVKRTAHLTVGGFPEDQVFRKAAEDLFYSLLLRRYLKGRRLEQETVVYEMRQGNHLDRYRDWLTEPFDKSRNGFTPEEQEAANAVMRRRVAEIRAALGRHGVAAR